MTPNSELIALAEPDFEPDACDRRAPEVEAMAARLAHERGGQTHPLSSYDLDRAEEIVTGEVNLRAENDRLRKLLQPFAEAAESLDEKHPDRDDIWESGAAMGISAGDLRAAANALRARARSEAQ